MDRVTLGETCFHKNKMLPGLWNMGGAEPHPTAQSHRRQSLGPSLRQLQGQEIGEAGFLPAHGDRAVS